MERLPKIVAVTSLLVASGLGSLACNTRPESNPAPAIVEDCQNQSYEGSGVLEAIRFIGMGKSGYVNAVNGGGCVNVYNPETLQTIDTIAPSESMGIICDAGPKPEALRVSSSYGKVEGNVNLNVDLAIELHNPDSTKLLYCSWHSSLRPFHGSREHMNKKHLLKSMHSEA